MFQSLRPLLVSAASAALVPLTATAGEITFEEIIASNDSDVVLSEEYTDHGVHFLGVDGSIWHGLSLGDPGGFGLEGTNGPSFLGFDGGGIATTIVFDEPVSGFKLDVARANGGTFHFYFQLTGYLDGEEVERQPIVLGPVGVWTHLAFTSDVDTVELWNVGDVRYGIDDVRWEGGAPPPTSTLAADVEVRGPMGRRHRGVTPVVLYGGESFDVEEVDPTSLSFGTLGARLAHANGPHPADIDGDGWLDWMMHFRSADVGHSTRETLDAEACVSGALLDGTPFIGCPAPETAPPMRRR